MVSVTKNMVNLWLPWSIVLGFIVKSLLIFLRVVLSALAPPKPIIKRYDYLSAKLLL